jgi:hypothetical protein
MLETEHVQSVCFPAKLELRLFAYCRWNQSYAGSPRNLVIPPALVVLKILKQASHFEARRGVDSSPF